jgi:hypothetical protein
MFAIEEILRSFQKYLITLLKDLFIKNFYFLRVFYAGPAGIQVCQNEYFSLNSLQSYLLYYLLSSHRVPLFAYNYFYSLNSVGNYTICDFKRVTTSVKYFLYFAAFTLVVYSEQLMRQ